MGLGKTQPRPPAGTHPERAPSLEAVTPQLAHEVLLIEDFAVSVWLHTEVNPSDDEWNRAVAEAANFLKANAMPLSRLRTFVISDGAAPSSAQRARLANELFRGQKSKISVVTTVLSNPVKRGVATALTWINPSFGFFTPEQMQSALAHVDLQNSGLALWSVYRRLQTKLGPNHALELIAKAAALPLIRAS